jgi:hypothetical protein
MLSRAVSRLRRIGSFDLYSPLRVIRCGLGELLRRVGLVVANVEVLNDERIWRRKGSVWTPLLAKDDMFS